jgi:hypothetical protein
MLLSWVRDEQGLEEWDDFLLRSPRGHYGQLSTWLSSFGAYGFDFEVLTARAGPGEPVRGGIGCLSFGHLGFRLSAAPIGPIVDPGWERGIEPLLEEALERARERGAAIFEYLLPSSEAAVPFLLPAGEAGDLAGARPGWPVKAGKLPAQMLWIDVSRGGSGADWDEGMLATFDAATRRNVRLSLRNGLTARPATTERELEAAWRIVESNAAAHGYAVRRWSDFRKTLLGQIRKDQAVVLTAWSGERILGCVYGVLAGRRLSYLMGGTLRTEPDLKVGHFTHWQAMKRARDLNLLGYDLTSGGSAGVVRFKQGFNPEKITFSGHRHVRLRPLRASLLEYGSSLAARRKAQIGTILSGLARLTGRR